MGFKITISKMNNYKQMKFLDKSKHKSSIYFPDCKLTMRPPMTLLRCEYL